MKIISLNTWGGRVHQPLVEFLHNHTDIDVFCFQEIYHDAPEPIVEDKGDRLRLFDEIKEILPEHTAFFVPDFSTWFGTAMLVKNNHTVIEAGSRPIYVNSGAKGNHPRNLQFATIDRNGSPLTIVNLHGLWNGGGKTDTEDRLEQSRRIAAFATSVANDLVICGDFNLEPTTQSVRLLEEAGLRNLIKEYGITSTRTSYYTKQVKFADYAFTKGNITVRDFSVLPDEVSDHSALLLEIE